MSHTSNFTYTGEAVRHLIILDTKQFTEITTQKQLPRKKLQDLVEVELNKTQSH